MKKLTRFMRASDLEKLTLATTPNDLDLVFLQRLPQYQTLLFEYKVDITITRVDGKSKMTLFLNKLRLAMNAFRRELVK